MLPCSPPPRPGDAYTSEGLGRETSAAELQSTNHLLRPWHNTFMQGKEIHQDFKQNFEECKMNAQHAYQDGTLISDRLLSGGGLYMTT